ncbi:MAG: hypothetical protein KGL39_45325 [Patescibacteria group bacterium]|nr:hypothetical protein [Patescibacteria group bacterium]MDE2104542.1 hypothetical protein [Patescibacteria group bacterium]
MIQQADAGWRKFKKSFHDSEVIMWARLQAILIPIVIGLHNVDFSTYISDRNLLVGYIAVNSVLTEVLRRHRETWGDQ